MALPGVEVRSSPDGRTFVHLPTTFSVRPPARERDLGTILGHHVTVAIRPVTYRWSFGDGTVRTTTGHGKRAPEASVRHSFERPETVQVSVRAKYHATYTVDRGRPRDIRDSVSVDGPEMTLPVEEAAAQLVDGPR